jgi:YidC/Oxa1 family membrane protein insertase
MEQRAFLAVVLMAAILIIYQVFFIPHDSPAPQPAGDAKQETRPAPSTGTATPSAPASAPAPAPLPVQVTPAPSQVPPRLTRVSTPLYDAVVSSDGGKFQEFTLHYRGDKPMVSVGELGPTGLVITRAGSNTSHTVAMQPSSEAVRVTAEQKSQDLLLVGAQDGLRVEETLTFHADSYAVGVQVKIANISSSPQSVAVTLPWITRQDWRDEKAKEKFQGQHPSELVWSAGGHIERVDQLCAVHDVSTAGAWIAMDSIWYMTALIPHSTDFRLVAQGEDKACESKSKQPVGRATVAVQATLNIPPGQAWEGRVTVFSGPKEYDRLKAVGIEGAINFGGFPIPRRWGGLPMEWLGVPILLLLNWVYRHVGNYGIAIILLTVVSKVLFYPLTVKSMRSMKAMQALQPQINAIRNKYKSDPQRMQKETMDLYREHKVNPMGGCLPMLAQVPIFYALYLALSVSVELQGATFICFGRLFNVDLWICDLASHDPTYILPVLMGITMFMQQKLTPVAGDPRQAKMMLVMPFVFTFMFLNLPAGLVLYWTVSNILQVAQQKLMDRPISRSRA